jgi:murein DD-endopeptidase MepM/ murein hydrolase activator NlpD
MNSRSILWICVIFTALSVLYLARPLGSSAKTAGELQGSITKKSATAGVLTSDIDRMSGKIRGLRGRIAKLQQRQNSVESDLSAKAARQERIANSLSISRDRLARLRKQLAYSRKILTARIIAVYKQGEPNIIQVALSSRGFADMVERTTYMERIASQDHKIITKVTRLKGQTTKETVKLAGLEREASRLVAQVRRQRDEVASAKGTLAAQRNELGAAVGSRKNKLAAVSKSLRRDREDLAAMQASNGSVVGALDNSAPIKRGSGQLIWPVNGQITSPFGGRWGRLHGALDIAVPTGTAVRASDSGTVRIAGWVGGYGNYVCVQHSSSMSTCYAHNDRLLVSVGQSVRKGQPVAASGNTGNSTGPHLHFEVRINGIQVDPMGYL